MVITLFQIEFLLLYDTFQTKNPEFPHGNYEQFDPDSMNFTECKVEFRVEKQGLRRLLAALRCEQRSICDVMEDLCMLLKELPTHAGSAI